jgi:hypothetical protein
MNSDCKKDCQEQLPCILLIKEEEQEQSQYSLHRPLQEYQALKSLPFR